MTTGLNVGERAQVPAALTIAGNASSGAGGMPVDLKTFHQLGVFGMAALTTLVSFDVTAGNATRQVIDPQVIIDQIRSSLTNADISAIKLGMIPTPQTIQAVHQALAEAKIFPPARSASELGVSDQLEGAGALSSAQAEGDEALSPAQAEGTGAQVVRSDAPAVVVDPVLVCKANEFAPETVADMVNLLLPGATVVTPNLPEAQFLAQMEIRSLDDLDEAARKIGSLGPKHVLVKGGARLELPGEVVDSWYDSETGQITHLSSPLYQGALLNGAGCTLAAAITAYLAKGSEAAEAIRLGREFVATGFAHPFKLHLPNDALWTGPAK
ncbi:hypothetical protein BK816_00315 [Boudabousia tangfeifanii]|uniref:pyridoxal kinase n=1 Tax=Boudabousia tangfeifanii TaxID=1912795 RepID=A0A1D9MI91_9ACTO|nr:hydroxymethylpyrimidine/phosphomethylpyrimidine kinase [Boudabousia tangfeifanii]AOZ71923.1 hypothetical protein BK816_00315 [Boudabousia tangfeifanii]